MKSDYQEKLKKRKAQPKLVPIRIKENSKDFQANKNNIDSTKNPGHSPHIKSPL